MNTTDVGAVMQRAMMTTLMVGGPIVMVSMAVGLVISIFQAATQINESTLSFVPKLVAVFLTLIVAGPWMIALMTDYMRRLFESIPTLIG